MKGPVKLTPLGGMKESWLDLETAFSWEPVQNLTLLGEIKEGWFDQGLFFFQEKSLLFFFSLKVFCQEHLD